MSPGLTRFVGLGILGAALALVLGALVMSLSRFLPIMTWRRMRLRVSGLTWLMSVDMMNGKSLAMLTTADGNVRKR